MISMNEQIENVVDLILEDYRGERDIDKINLLQQPDKEVMEWLEMYARKKGFEVELEEYE